MGHRQRLEELVKERTSELKMANEQLQQEMSERQRVERAVQEARVYAESIVETVREPLVVLDTHLRVISVNRSFQSYYTMRLDDAKAVHAHAMGAKGDGLADDTAAIQAAIDRVQDTTGHGVVFVREGRYRITRTLNVWPSIRVIGYGARRPVLLLPPRTPGFTDPAAENCLVFFAGARPGAAAGGRESGPVSRPHNANPGTFYSAMSNIDVEIGEGNAGAVGVRGTYAQHSFLAHMEFRLGPGGAGPSSYRHKGTPEQRKAGGSRSQDRDQFADHRCRRIFCLCRESHEFIY